MFVKVGLAVSLSRAWPHMSSTGLTGFVPLSISQGRSRPLTPAGDGMRGGEDASKDA